MRTIWEILKFIGRALVILVLLDFLVYSVFFVVHSGPSPTWRWVLMGYADAALLLGYLEHRYGIAQKISRFLPHPLSMLTVLVVVVFAAIGGDWAFRTIPLLVLVPMFVVVVIAVALAYSSSIGQTTTIELD